MEIMQLPSNANDLADALEQARSAAWPAREMFRTQCLIAHYYLNGYRHFRVFEGNRLMVGYETENGELRFRNESLRTQYKTELGRFMRMDLSPVVLPTEWGLNSIRNASISQVALDYATASLFDNSLKLDFLQQFFVFGTVGLGHWRTVGADGTYEPEIEVIPGWELLPLPKNPLVNRSIRGMMRYRHVPLEWLKKKMGPAGTKRVTSYSDADLEVVDCSYGTSPDDMGGLGLQPMSRWRSSGAEDARKDGKELIEKFVPLLEAWTYGPKDTVSRYIVKAGKKVIVDVDFYKERVRVARPITISKFIPMTGMYSYGLVSMLMAMNERNERMLQNLFKNVEDLDTYGVVMWPSTAGATVEEFAKKSGPRPKAVTYEPDYTVPDQKPYTIKPVNTGDFPGKVAAFGSSMQEKWAGIGPMSSGEAPGRLDSKPGLSMLYEVSQIASAAAAHQIADAFASVYRSVLGSLREDWTPDTTLRLSKVTDDVAGVVIGQDGSIALEENPLPNYWEVKIDVKDRQPMGREKRLQELAMHLQMQIIDPVDYRLICYRENLNAPVGNRQEYEEYRKAMFDNIVMFNDGKTPKDVVMSTALDDPEIQLRAIRGFTSRLEFRFASDAVRYAFEQRKKVYEDMLGSWPSAMPGSEMVADGAMAPQKRMAGMMGG